MNKLFVFALFALVAVAFAEKDYHYSFHATYSEKPFEITEGSNLVELLDSVNQRKTFFLWDAIFAPGQNSSTNVQYDHPIEKIAFVTFGWHAVDIREKKRINLKRVKIVPEYIESPTVRKIKTKTLCPPEPDFSLLNGSPLPLVNC